MANYKNNLDDLLKDETLTREQKTQAINDYYDNYRKSIDRDLNNYLTKQYIGAGLQIGSAAVPIGGAANIGSKIGIDLFAKTVGKKIASEVGAGMVSGMASGAVFGAGRGLSEGENVLKTMYEDSRNGMNFGMLGGGVGAYAKRFIDGKLLKKYGDIDILPDKQRQQYNTDAREYYKNYNQGIELGDINFTKRGIGETLRWNPKQAQNFPELLNDIKNATRLPDAPNLKPQQKPEVSHYEVYQGKNGLHHVEVAKDGHKRYYITKDTPAELTRATSTVPSGSIPGTNSANPIQTRAQDLGPSTIINDVDKNINPATVMVPGIIVGNNPSITKDTPAGTPLTTSQGSNRSILSSPAYSNQPRALGLEPNIIINDVDKNINPNQVTMPKNSTPAEPFKLHAEKFDWRTMPLADPWKKDKGKPTGFAAQVPESGQLFTTEQIGNMSREEFDKNEHSIMSQMKDGLIKNQAPVTNFSGFTNPISGSKQIFSREDIGAMSTDEFSNNEKAINAQLNTIGVPTSNELHNAASFGGGAVYIEPYTRSDGVQVKGHYRAR